MALLIVLSLTQCNILEEVLPKESKITSEWNNTTGTGGGSNGSMRNHYYTFEVKGDKKLINIVLTADIDVGITLFDRLGQTVGYRYPGRSLTMEQTLNEGTYTLLVYTQKRYDIGKYTLTATGISSELVRVSSQRLNAEKISFGADGGGGQAYTFRNHIYRFDVTEDNSVVDASLDITQNNGFLVLYNSLGQQIAYTYGGRSEQIVIEDLKKGKYSLLVGTNVRDAVSSVYDLNIFGKVQNLERVSSQAQTIADSWSGLNTSNNYTLRITEDNSILDVTLKSPTINGYLILKDPLGNQLRYTYSGRNQFIIHEVNKGVYTIIAGPDEGNGRGNYSLIVYGQFADLKKL